VSGADSQLAALGVVDGLGGFVTAAFDIAVLSLGFVVSFHLSGVGPTMGENTSRPGT
jgi:hypothetical protein